MYSLIEVLIAYKVSIIRARVIKIIGKNIIQCNFFNGYHAKILLSLTKMIVFIGII